ncbi:MAG TPA: amidohydrolase family protein [Gammaproteobacteria bacterium]|nr:amidohydrolase family protein [Gammaproteobacteria bacterium]
MSDSGKPYLRIATEEAYAPPDLIERYRKAIRDGSVDDPGFRSLMGYFLFNDSPATNAIVERLQDLDARRIADMDATGIERQIVSLTGPGVQIFDAATAVGLAETYNDALAEAIARHPDRLAGLAAVAPQNPARAARELERAVTKLGLKGAIINSHTHGEYLDDAKFWPIFEAAEALGVPVYIHPQTPPRQMIEPFLERGLDGAIFGFAVETGLHLLRIIVSGAFDRFPKLRIVVGHLGEGLPYWLFRIDFFHGRSVRTKRYEKLPPLEKRPSDYMRENVYVTTSGMAWEPVILYAQQVLGFDRVLYAMDYPYQYVPDEVRVTDELPIGDEEKRDFYERNAKRVFGL